MNDTLNTIMKASDIFLKNHVELDLEKIEKFKIELDEISIFFKPPIYLEFLYTQLEKEEVYQIIHVYNAINASLQYCFFLGNSSVRFDSIDSFWIMNTLDSIFQKNNIQNTNDIKLIKNQIIEALIDSNITLLETRVATIEEVFEKLDFEQYGLNYLNIDKSIGMLKKLVCFKRDIFFKKGLFAIMITSRMIPQLRKINETYNRDILSLPIPADYQIPKMLRYFGLIKFSDQLAKKIELNEHLDENSEEELNIRAATIKACELIAKRNNVSGDDVDAYLFMKRKETDLKHHMCITTNY